MIAFGPVPSRRLGQSLGINNIPPKICSYSCIYCQVGRTDKMRIERSDFYGADRIVGEVREKVEGAGKASERIDYLTFVSDGEPTLDLHLGDEIKMLKPLGIKIGVISNASLIDRPDVREALMGADWVSLKVDSTEENVWRAVDRPHHTLKLDSILDGALEFAQTFKGELVSETMLVRGVNDGEKHIQQVAEFLARLQPARSYLSIPTRPPAEGNVRSPDEAAITCAFQILSQKVDRVEYLIGYEGNAFAFTGDVEQDLLSITAVHPMREEAVTEFLSRAGADWVVVKRMVDEERLVELEYEGVRFYMRKLS
ncbi:MAG: radical SAM protein [Anaerolineales bacterium]|nr:radical SAM protein [Anaerolineales bacterium]